MGIECNDAHLGLASTRELLKEISARGMVESRYKEEGIGMSAGADRLVDTLPGSMLEYRMVDE